MIAAAERLGLDVGVAQACSALGVSRASLYRRRRPKPPSPARRPSPRRLAPEERDNVHRILCSDRFVDRAPEEIVPTLLDEGSYYCSPRTMYRILAERGSVRERRRQLIHPEYRKPELLATAPNQVWSWDTTRLRGPEKWKYYYLYTVLDIFSRYVVAWMVAEHECASHASRLFRSACDHQGVAPGQLAVHADRGAVMTSKTLAQLFADLGVTRSYSRPHTSNDNPYSESHFKTVKYFPDYPDRFQDPLHARSCVGKILDWYNYEHRHSAIAYMTPHAMHYSLAPAVLQRRQQTLAAAFSAHPERFVRGLPSPPAIPTAAWINPPRAQSHDPVALAH